MSDDGNGIIALAQENNEAFHSQEMAMQASLRMRLFMFCYKTIISLGKAKTFYVFNVLAYLQQLKTVKEKLLSNFLMKHFEHYIIKLLKFGK